MPEDMLHRLCASKHLFGASEMQLQVTNVTYLHYYVYGVCNTNVLECLLTNSHVDIIVVNATQNI